LNCEYRGACIVNIIPDVVPEWSMWLVDFVNIL
jgi:hypothetical protein